MKKTLALLSILIISVLIIQLIRFGFILVGSLDKYSEVSQSLYKILSGIDWEYFFLVFVIFFIINLLANLSVVLVYGIFIWLVQTKDSKEYFTLKHAIFSHYYTKYRVVHIFFFLLTLFMTISIAAPSMVMNSFMAILGISTFVSTLSKRKGDR